MACTTVTSTKLTLEMVSDVSRNTSSSVSTTSLSWVRAGKVFVEDTISVRGGRTALSRIAALGSSGMFPSLYIVRRSNLIVWLHSASKEKDSSRNHRIDDDGYNRGRDFFVERAVAGTHWQGMWWKAEVEWRTGLMPHGKKGMVLSISIALANVKMYILGINHGIPVDGRVAILTVKRL